MADRYGDFVLYKPLVTAKNLLSYGLDRLYFLSNCYCLVLIFVEKKETNERQK